MRRAKPRSLKFGSLPTIEGQAITWEHRDARWRPRQSRTHIDFAQLLRVAAVDPVPRVEIEYQVERGRDAIHRTVLCEADEPRSGEANLEQVNALFDKVSYVKMRHGHDVVLSRGWTAAPHIEKEVVLDWPIDTQPIGGGYRTAAGRRVVAQGMTSLFGRASAWLRSRDERAFAPHFDDPRWSLVIEAVLTTTTLTFRERGATLYQLPRSELRAYCEPHRMPPLFVFGRTCLSFADNKSSVAQKLRAQLR